MKEYKKILFDNIEDNSSSIQGNLNENSNNGNNAKIKIRIK